MRNFHLSFAYPWAPWLFLLLIPVVLFTLIPYFRLDKRYRKTRNRITSMVLHLLIMTLAICVLTGFTFVYEVGNPENELLLLVDVSDTEKYAQERRDQIVEDLILDSSYDRYKIGVVTFGFTQVNAVPFTAASEDIYEQYLSAETPDTTATDIAAALRYARSLITNPESAKIVLITDGKETDEEAMSVVGAIAAQGTRVDAVYVSSALDQDDVQVTDIIFPNYHIDTGDDCEISVTIQSEEATTASVVELYDNGKTNETLSQTLPLSAGTQTVIFNTAFDTEGLHEIRIRVREERDTVQPNNEYCAYYYLQRFNRVLIIERKDESDDLVEMLKSEEGKYDPTVLNLNSEEDLPGSVDDLRKYDQIILNNIANSDISPNGLDELLYSYVYDYGGGLFTAGGNGDDGNAHAYNRVDMYNSLYQQMLPVQAIEYTPPVGVMVLIDTSGSMQGDSSEEELTPDAPLYWALRGAVACLSALTERDYIGVMTLDSVAGEVLDPTPRTRESYIRETILGIRGTGGTLYSDAIRRAGQKLRSCNVDKRHIIVVSDGQPSKDDEKAYMDETRENFADGITLSFVGIDLTPEAETKMNELVEAGGGKLHKVDTSDLQRLLTEMTDDLNAPLIKESSDEPFHPEIADAANVLSPLFDGVEYGRVEEETEGGTVIKLRALDVQLGGFYGVKVRSGAELFLMGNYQVPIYAQWKFGKGSVGSFMCDLNGNWSEEFMNDANGKRFLLNAISNLMPLENIEPKKINVSLHGDNYINQADIFYESLQDGETVRATLVDTQTGAEYSLNEVTGDQGVQTGIYVTSALDASNKYSRCSFVIKKSGTYRITVTQYDAQGGVIASSETYKSFSYSLEYDRNMEDTDLAAHMTALATRGNGLMIENEENLGSIFENFVTALVHTFDPRWLFMGLAMALFLLDIAARKFKFKWPHELIREHREKKASVREENGRKE